MRWLIPLLLGAAACSPAAPETYPPQFEYTFMRACQAREAAVDICPCTWDKIEANVPVADFVEFEQLPASRRVGHPMETLIAGYARECVAELGTPGAAPR